MAKYFAKFPVIPYDIAKTQFSNYQVVTNIFSRIRIIRDVLQNITAYYVYLIKDDDTPEILAEKIYGNPEAHWIILMANDIVDAQYDWPLNSRKFKKFIIKKYGSISTAKTTYHHYEKVINREESFIGTDTETRFVIDQTKLTNNSLSVPYDYYSVLPETQSVSTYNLANNRTVIETVRRDRISYYDYENSLNESKRTIKIIKPEYYSQIMLEFDRMTDFSSVPYLRKLI